MREISGREIILQRLARNGLSAPFAETLGCVSALAGIQSQFQQWAEVSIMNRHSDAITMQDMAVLYREHDIINLWGQRRTLHMYVKEDWNAVCDLYEPVLSEKPYANRRFPEDFAWLIEQIAEECSANHSISKAKVLKMAEERMQGRHTKEDSLEYTLIILCCLRGIFFGLPDKPGIKNFIGRKRLHAAPWQTDESRARAALEHLMLRYFQHYGPATLADFSHWAGLPQTAAKRRMASLEDRLTAYTYNGREYFSHGETDDTAPDDAVFLLGKFDPLFVSYKHKDWIIPEKLQKRVWRNAGWVEALVLDGDKAVGTWRHTLKGQKMSLEVSQFSTIKVASRKKLRSRVERLAEFWEKKLDAITFS